MFRTSNPALRNDAYSQSWDDLGGQVSYGNERAAAAGGPKIMTMQGTVNKSALLISFCAASALFAWNLSLDQAEGAVAMTGWTFPLLLGGLLGGFLTMLIASFKPQASVVLGPICAICEGGFVGALSAVYAVQFAADSDMLNTGLIFNAALLTFGIFGGLLAAYSTKMLRPNKTFYNVVITASMGVGLYALVAIGASFFGAPSLASVFDPSNGGLLSIGFSVVLVLLASANLVLDFDLINNGVKNRAPKYMEWYSGMALLVTLVWLYVEVLRLLAKLQSRD
ncbi:MAG: Bax inhibitor-1/YccA family protein [Planctomycetota bacterium]